MWGLLVNMVLTIHKPACEPQADRVDSGNPGRGTGVKTCLPAAAKQMMVRAIEKIRGFISVLATYLIQ